MKRAKLIAPVALVVMVAIGFLFLPINDWFDQSRGYIDGLGVVGPVVVVVAYVAMTVLLIPGSALTVGAGTIFGLWIGVLVVIVGANVGALCSFLLARSLLRKKVEGWASENPKFSALDRAIGRQGFKMVFLSRLSPAFPFTLLNYLLGLTTVRTGSYVLANLIGMLPGTFLYVYIGATLGEAIGSTSDESAGGPFKLVLQVVGLLATIAVVVLVTRTARRAIRDAEAEPASGDETVPEVAPS